MTSALFLIFVSLAAGVLGKVPGCCSSIKDSTTCRRYCQQILEMQTSIQQMQQLQTAAEHCPKELVSFWSCLNTSLTVVRDTEAWPGRPCCDLATGAQCRRRCLNANSKGEVRRVCNSNSDVEKSLFTCLRKQEEGETCCKQSQSLSCRMVCRSHYLTSSPRNTPPSPLHDLSQHCKGSPVKHCMQEKAQTQRASDPTDKLPCCDHAKTKRCRDTCRTALQSTRAEEQIVEDLSNDCGTANIMDPMWTCFLWTQPSRSNHTPAARLDNARLQCCGKAITSRCRDLCTQLYKSGWSYHTEFYKSCSYIQPVSTVEATMHKCITDVDEPCQLGCKGLSFCTNFNHRPTELFRSCSREADRAAKKAFELWQNGLIHLPQMKIPVKDVRTCEPEKWKAIACALQVKPCLKQPFLLSLCKEDCIDILNKCVDHKRLSNEQSVPQLCNTLPSANTPGACIPLAHHLRVSPYSQQEEEVTHPCNPHPCRKDEVCEIRRRKCKHPDSCAQFICKSACSLGQVSSMLVATGTYVRIPNPDSSSADTDCFLGCRCDSKGELEHCRPLTCLHKRSCMLGTGNEQDHGSHFLLDKSQCICHDGTLVCSQQTCPANNLPAHLSGSPRECTAQYKPVCGANGKTYPNNCFAKCGGITRLVSATSCSEYDPCQSSPCNIGESCVVRRQVCLGEDAQVNCPQYECISAVGLCNSHNHDAVCDTSGEEFTNACLLFSHHRSMAYRGHCQDWCDVSGPVCGHDGETYSSECAARAAGVTMDYEGSCRALGNLTRSNAQTMSCSRVECVPVRPANCRGVIPSGACCPVCAAQLRTLYSSRLVGVAARRMEQGPLTVQHVVSALSRVLMVAQCQIFGFLSLDADLILLIAPVTNEPSEVQVEACNSEAGRLETLIAEGSPTLSLYLELSPLLLAPAQSASVSYSNSMYNVGSASSSTAFSGILLSISLCLTLVLSSLRLHHRH
ncbi:reversion-inducing cysteine-rich protein with Kazal motifs-like [Littorina saxatilis]|uniref:reversion-inducing cysteine-rich protein with Kazal motifs-like n=1 Tax=Littorina saxatilis TaxID=31220 RepID=UPI0038B4C0F5